MLSQLLHFSILLGNMVKTVSMVPKGLECSKPCI